jgi:hypothetical protein
LLPDVSAKATIFDESLNPTVLSIILVKSCHWTAAAYKLFVRYGTFNLHEYVFTSRKIFLEKRRSSGTLYPAFTEVKAVQPLKAISPMEVTDEGIVMEVNPVQFKKA